MDGNRYLLSLIDFILSVPKKSPTPVLIDDNKLKNEFVLILLKMMKFFIQKFYITYSNQKTKTKY